MEGFQPYFCRKDDPPDWKDDTTSRRYSFRLMTIWSAPNYAYRSGNKAAVMILEENRPGDGGDPKNLVKQFETNKRRIVTPDLEKAATPQYFA
jgi:hypothetical protein